MISLSKKAEPERALAGDPESVAGFAKMIGIGRDHANSAGMVRVGEFKSRPIHGAARRLTPAFFDKRSSQKIRTQMFGLKECGCGPGRHELDESHSHRAGADKLNKTPDFTLGAPSHEDSVDFDRGKLKLERPIDSGKDGRKLPAPGDFEEALFIEAIDTHIERADACKLEPRRKLPETVAVGGEGYGLNSFNRRKRIDDCQQVAPQRGLASREADLGHAESCKSAGQTGDLGKREGGLGTSLLLVAARQAVAAAEVARIRNGEPEVAEPAAKGVPKDFGPFWGVLHALE